MKKISLSAHVFLSTWKRPNRNPKYDAALIDEAQDFDPSWFQCALRLMRDPHDDEQRMLFYVALTRAKDFLAAIPKECRDLLLFLLKMALYDREWLFAVLVIFSPFHALRANCSLSRSGCVATL
jgi:superfamily I DNA/RNA helicase